MELLSLPTQLPGTSRKQWLLWAGVPSLLIAGAAAWWVWANWRGSSDGLPSSAKFHLVEPAEMVVKIVKEGELQAVNNLDIVCMVEGGSTIVEIVKEGAYVKKGDTLVVLDSSGIRERIETTSLDLKKAESDLTMSKELLQIQESQNSANLDAATVELELAKLALEQYVNGTYPQSLADAETLLKMAKITVENKEEALVNVKELHRKEFVTAVEVKDAELSLTTVHNDLKKAETALRVLTQFAHPMSLAQNKSAVAQADQKLARTQKENASNLSKAKADVEAKEQALAILKKRADRLNEQLAYCTITAPADGLVIYNQNNNSYSTGPLQEGSQVRERQTLLRLPETTTMKAIVRINESQVNKLEVGQRATLRISGLEGTVDATLNRISPVSESGSRWMNPDLREYPVELVLDHTPPNLKPGVSVTSEIFIDNVKEALSVPLTALYTEGADSFVFVRAGDGLKPVKVQMAQTNDTHARLTTGVAAGSQVMLLEPGQGRTLLEKNGIKPAPLPAHRLPKEAAVAHGEDAASSGGRRDETTVRGPGSPADGAPRGAGNAGPGRRNRERPGDGGAAASGKGEGAARVGQDPKPGRGASSGTGGGGRESGQAKVAD